MNYLRFSLLLAVSLALIFGLKAFSAGDPEMLWVASSKGVSRVLQAGGAVTLEIASGDTQALAVDAQRKRIWAYAGKQLLSYGFDGQPLSMTPLDPPAGNPALLLVDTRAERIWLAVHSQLMLFDGQGRALWQTRLPNPIAGMTLDRSRSQLWVAHKGTLQLHDATGELLGVLNTPDIKLVRGLDYDAKLDQVWVAADDTMRRFAPSGAQKLSVTLDWLAKPTLIASDQDGHLWLTDSRQVARMNSAGAVEFYVAPSLDALGPFVVSLVTDARNHAVWIATARRVARYGADGALLDEFTLAGGDPSRLIRQLALPAGPIAPQIEFTAPAPGDILNVSRPTFVVRYSGESVDTGSLMFTADAASLPVSCSAGPETAACSATQALADGTHDIAATIADSAGNVSDLALVRIAIDTVAPVITVTSPSNGLLTNVASARIEGALSEAAALTLNDSGVALTDLRFSHAITLTEGRNDFALSATDEAGNAAARALFVTLDTVPPPAPVSGAIEARAAGGQVTITGGAGSVEGGSQVMLVNARTGERVTVTASADGSFSATLAGEPGDAIQIYATDRATNQGASASVAAVGGPFSGPITFGGTQPGNGVIVNGDRLLVLAALTAPPNTGMTVNDVIAACVPVGEETHCYAEVPLVTGSNTIAMKAHGQDGRVVTKTINVTSRGPFPYRVVADRSVGVTPLKPRVEVWDVSGRGIREIRLDVEANGVVDFVVAPGAPIDLSYTGVGVRQARVIVVDNAGQLSEQRLTFVLLDLPTVDKSIQAVWGAMNSALASGNKASAMSYLSEQARETYGPVFDALMPQMPQIVASYSTPKRSLVMQGYAEYGVNRVVEGKSNVFLIGFVTSATGTWQLESM